MKHDVSNCTHRYQPVGSRPRPAVLSVAPIGTNPHVAATQATIWMFAGTHVTARRPQEPSP